MSVMLITGASRGIGAATARLAARRGYAIGVNYRRDRDAAEKVCAEIEAGGGRAFALQADVASEDQVLNMFDAVERELGALTVLVNNAGILERQCRLVDLDLARLQRVFATNVIGGFLCAREAARRLPSGGAIVNVSSAASRIGGAGEYIDYAASKGALDTMTLGLAKELADSGVRVNAVRPGLIHTDIHASGGEPGRVERLSGQVPLRRGGDPGEVAEAILWLASAGSSYVTGVLLDVSGGR